MFKILLITAFAVINAINAQTVSTTTKPTNNIVPINVANPSVINGTSRPNPNVPITNNSATGNVQAPLINQTRPALPKPENTTKPTNQTNTTQPLPPKPVSSTNNSISPPPVLPNDPKPFTPYDDLVSIFNNTIEDNLDLFVRNKKERTEIENIIYNNNFTGFREQSHQTTANSMLNSLNNTGIDVSKSTGLTPLDVATTLHSSSIVDDVNLGYSISKAKINQTLGENGIYNKSDPYISNKALQKYQNDTLTDVFKLVTRTASSDKVNNTIIQASSVTNTYLNNQSTGDLINKIMDGVFSSVANQINATDSAIQKQSAKNVNNPIVQQPKDYIGAFIEGIINAGTIRKPSRKTKRP